MNRNLAAYISTCAAGWIPFAPGTWGSALGLALGYIIVDQLGWFEMTIAFVLVTLLGTYASSRYMKLHEVVHDPKEIIIDEVAGQWLTLLTPILLLHLGTWLSTGALHVIALDRHWVTVYFGIAFLLFRLFDIAKPWPISFIDRRVKGGIGVMLDDIFAGLAGGVILYIIYVVGPIVWGMEDSTF